MKDYSAYLFDLDGTLVDSERLKGKALSETCRLFGGRVEASIYKEVMGESWFQVTKYFFKVAEIKPDIDKFNAEFRIIYQELLRIELTPNPSTATITSAEIINTKTCEICARFIFFLHQF